MSRKGRCYFKGLGISIYVWQISFDVQLKAKVSCGIFKNKNECQLTSTFYSKMWPQFWLTHFFVKTNILNNQYAILICTKKNLSIERKYTSVSHVSSNVEDGSPIHCINFKPTKRNPQKSIKGLQVQPIAQVVFDCILFGKSSLTLPRHVPS